MASSLGVCIPGCMCTGGGIHYMGCTFITGAWHPPVLHPLQGGCTFIAGGVHTRMHVYWGWHPLQEVYLHNWGVASTSAASTTGGCTFIAGGVHTRTHVYWGCTFIATSEKYLVT